MKQITLYTTDRCSFCERTKVLLRRKGLSYNEVNLSRDPDGRAELASRTGLMTFPQVLVEDELLGGYAETVEAVANGRLDALLAA
jgi:glutaredoxin 3